MRGCVFPVAAADAIAWARGRLNDLDLVLNAPLKAEAVFLLDLPNRKSYRSIIRRCVALQKKGAVLMVLRTGNDVVARHLLEKNPGCLLTRIDQDGRSRFICPPDVFFHWIAKFTR